MTGLLATLDETILTPVARRALGRETAEVRTWRAEPVHGGVGGGGIYRIAGRAEAGSKALEWSVILKVVRATADWLDPATLRCWAREPLAYRSGALDELPAGLVAAKSRSWRRPCSAPISPGSPTPAGGVIRARFVSPTSSPRSCASPSPWSSTLLDERSDPWLERTFGRPMDHIISTWIDLRRYLFRLADEAQELVDSAA